MQGGMRFRGPVGRDAGRRAPPGELPSAPVGVPLRAVLFCPGGYGLRGGLSWWVGVTSFARLRRAVPEVGVPLRAVLFWYGLRGGAFALPVGVPLRAVLFCPGGVWVERGVVVVGGGYVVRPPAGCADLGGRRSLAGGVVLPGGVWVERGVVVWVGVRVRPPSAGGAGPHRENWPEVGVPLPASLECVRRYAVSRPCGPRCRTCAVDWLLN